MSENIAIILSVTSYKLVSLLVGLLFAWMGYRLFMAGVWGESGDMDASLKDFRVTMKKAAPGTFFALFGTVVISFTLFKGLEFSNVTRPVAGPNGSGTQVDSSNLTAGRSSNDSEQHFQVNGVPLPAPLGATGTSEVSAADNAEYEFSGTGVVNTFQATGTPYSGD